MKKKRIFARYFVPTEEEFARSLEKHAKFFKMSTGQYLDRYIRFRLDDIQDSQEKIFREKERIKKAKLCIEIADSFRSNKNPSN